MSGELFRHFVEILPEPALLLETNGSISAINSAAGKLLRCQGSALLGRNFAELVFGSEEDLTVLTRRWQLSSGLMVGDLCLRAADGDVIQCRAEGGLLAPGVIFVRCFHLTDTTLEEQKRLVEQLRRANEDLNQFAYSASHDLKEPLRMVAVYSQLLQRKVGHLLDRDAAEYLTYAIQGAQRMETLVSDLLTYTEAATVDVVTAGKVASNAGFQKALSNLRLSIEESGAEIDCGPLPEVWAHEVHLVQLFQNLVGNAIKYRAAEPVRIKVQAVRRAEEWEFSVADNGIGIAPEYHSLIFGVFKRLHSRTHSPGTGIGLAICKKIVERYGGRLWVDSEEGKGSTFYFTLRAA